MTADQRSALAFRVANNYVGRMKIYRAYVRDAAGVITWAAWIEASDEQDAQLMANAKHQETIPTVELWSATKRRLADTVGLDPV